MKKITILFTFLLCTTLLFAESIDEELYSAVSDNNLEKVESLLSEGANPNYVLNKGMVKVSPLITAIINKNFKIAELLVENEADVNFRDGFETTPLMYAASSGNYEITKLLIDNDANVDAVDNNGNDIYEAGVKSRNREVIELLSEYNEEKVMLYDLIVTGDELCKEQNDLEKGISNYTKAIALTSDNAELYMKRGGAFFYQKDFEKAISDFSNAISEKTEDPANAYFMRGLAKSLLPTEDVKGACEDFRKAKELGFSTKGLSGLNEYCGTNDLE